jgi:hypothetical protein
MWWLLRRKQRERYADGRVYFFDNGGGGGLRDRPLEAHGVAINGGVERGPGEYSAFWLPLPVWTRPYAYWSLAPLW